MGEYWKFWKRGMQLLIAYALIQFVAIVPWIAFDLIVDLVAPENFAAALFKFAAFIVGGPMFLYFCALTFELEFLKWGKEESLHTVDCAD